MVVLLYVDNMIITRNNKEEVSRLQDELAIRFDIKKFGELYSFIGLEVINMKNGIFVSRESYAKKLVERFGLNQSKKCSTPLEVNKKLSREEGSLLPKRQPYRAFVASVQFWTITRQYIAFSIGSASKFMQSPRKHHLEAVKTILKCINLTLDMGLFFKKSVSPLVCFTDADFGGDLDDQRSTSGYAFLCGNMRVSWCSEKQDSVSLPTTEAEYKAPSLTAQECIWLQRLADDLRLSVVKPTTIYGDNHSAIKLANNPGFHAKSKHIELKKKLFMVQLMLWR